MARVCECVYGVCGSVSLHCHIQSAWVCTSAECYLLVFAFICAVCRKEVQMYRAMTNVHWNFEAKPPEISGCILKFQRIADALILRS